MAESIEGTRLPSVSRMKAVMVQMVRFILSRFVGSGQHEWSEWSEESKDGDENVDVGG